MISVQPIKLWHYLGFKRNKTPKNLHRLFYLSFEDALWDLFKHKKIPKRSYILLPEFYCGDVIDNIKSRGYDVIYYPVRNDLTSDIKEFLIKIERYSPRIIIVFHPVGIESNLFKDRKWIKNLPDNTLLVEDSVHRIVNPKKIKIYKRNHFVIDSLRKVIPLQGSNIYGLPEDLNYNSPPFYQSLVYSLKVHILWLLMVLCLEFGFGKLAEKLMIRGYDLIGDSKIPAPGSVWFKFIADFINYDKINKLKEKQIRIYIEKLGKSIEFKNSDWEKMRGFPVLLKNNKAQSILNYLRDHNLKVRFELADSIWTKKQKIIYLPLGPYLKDHHINDISELVLKSFEYE